MSGTTSIDDLLKTGSGQDESMVDDILDNIISSKLIEDKLNLPVVSCSPILSQEHYDIFYDSNIHGIRLKSYKILDNLCTIW